MSSRFLTLATVLVLLFSAGAEASEETGLPSLVIAADDWAVAALSPSAEDRIASTKFADAVAFFEIVQFDQVLLERLRRGDVTKFLFRVNEENEFVLERTGVMESEGLWILSCAVLDQESASEARIFVREDGTILGDVRVPKTGMFIIDSTSQPPYHFIYRRNASFPID